MQTHIPAPINQANQQQCKTSTQPTQLIIEPQGAFGDEGPEMAEGLQLRRLMDNRLHASHGTALQVVANNSQRARDVRALQTMMDNSTRARETKALQKMANSCMKTNPPVQRRPEGELLQAKTIINNALGLETTTEATKPNNTGLPDNLKSGIESLSGISMDHVRVHYNSSQPAQLNALAYAQASEIHVAPGQEQHVPHEAWHVVQQVQGRVKPTMQMKAGVAVNDDLVLEREAEMMGAKAAEQKSGHVGMLEPSPSPLQFNTSVKSPGVINQEKVLQLVASQIALTNKKISSVIIRGRPPSIFSGSMGDHTTAFILQIEGLNIALQGKTIEHALNYVNGLQQHLLDLPGFQHFTTDTKAKKQFDLELKTMSDQSQPPTNSEDINLSIQRLQLAINAYLNARELVPFSVVNIGAVSKGVAGKGHGESAPAAVLSTFERSENQVGINEEQLIDAICKLFDMRSAGMLAAETNSDLFNQMTGGVIAKKPDISSALLENIWQQHVKTIHKMFPKVFAKVSEKLDSKTPENNLTRITKNNITYLIERSSNGLDQIQNSLNNFKLRSPPKNFDGEPRLNRTLLFCVSDLYMQLKKVHSFLQDINLLNMKLNGAYDKDIGPIEKKLVSLSKRIDEAVALYNHELDSTKVDDFINEETKKLFSTEFKFSSRKNIEAAHNFRLGNPSAGFEPRSTASEDEKVNDVLDSSTRKTRSQAAYNSKPTNSLAGFKSPSTVSEDEKVNVVSDSSTSGKKIDTWR